MNCLAIARGVRDVLLACAMSTDPILEAQRLALTVAELMQGAAISSEGHRRSELRYAEALARTLFDQLAVVREQDKEEKAA
jgi:uncharacterized membrane protein affecting hemolysin expression